MFLGKWESRLKDFFFSLPRQLYCKYFFIISFSTGGDYQDDNLYPGVGIYHQGMDLIAVVSTDEDVWELRVRGQLVNETWSNIGIRWAPYVEDSGMYVKL